MESLSIDVSALQDLPLDEERAATDDLVGSELGGCLHTCSWTCSITSLTTAAAA